MKHTDKKAFFDGEVEIQRFDIVRHASIEKLNTVMLNQFWIPEEIDVTKDKNDFKELAPHLQHIFTSNLKRQIVLDTKQGREPLKAFLPLASSPENECAITEWSFQELIHSRSYTHILRGILNNPSEVFDTVFDTPEIDDLSKDISKHYDALIAFNNLKDILDGDFSQTLKDVASKDYDLYEHKKAFYRAIFAVNALEGVRFYVSFVCSWAFAELMDTMEGNAKIIKLIARDENGHLKLTQTYLTRILKEDPDFVKIQKELEHEMIDLYLEVVRQEKAWAKYLFKDGAMLGLNEVICCDYIDWIAARRLNTIGIQYPLEYPKSNPIPWTSHWVGGGNKQTALQEAENDSYLLGILTGDMDNAADILSIKFRNLIDKTLGDVEVYSRNDCVYCTRAKTHLESLGIPYNEIQLERDEFLKIVPKEHTTYPGIFIGGIFIGGCEDMIDIV